MWFYDLLLRALFTRRQYKHIDFMDHIICFKSSKCLITFPALKRWPDRVWSQFSGRFYNLLLRVLFTQRQYKHDCFTECIIYFKPSKCFKPSPELRGWPNRAWIQFYVRFHDLSLRVHFMRRQYKLIDLTEHIICFKHSKCFKPFLASKGVARPRIECILCAVQLHITLTDFHVDSK